MADKVIDVKTETDSSTVSTTASDNAADVKEESADSSSEQTSSADLAKGFEAAVKEGFDKATSQEPESSDNNVEKKEESQTEEKGPIPYDRFKEVNEAKSQLETRWKEAEPFVAAQKSIGDFCLKNNITNEDFSYWLNVAAAARTNPEEALKLLQPLTQELSAFKGDVLNSDLQKAVDDGDISLDYAKRLASAENKAKFTQNQSKLTLEQVRQQETQRYVREVQTSFVDWARAKAQADPDFQPKANPEGEDGKFEFVLHKMNAEYVNAGIKSPQDLLSFADRIYSSVNKSFGRFFPQKNGSKVVKSGQSTSSASNNLPKTFEEAVAMGARKAGVHFTPQVIK